MRAPQPPTPPPIIIHECPSPPPTPPPLILRERPPKPPEPIPTEIGLNKTILNILNYINYIDLYILVTRYLPPSPKRPRPRSLIINRYPSLPEKQRNRPIFSFLFNYYWCYLGKIIIERGIPYQPQPERQVIACPADAPSPIKYPQSYYKTSPFETPIARIARRFEKLVSQEYPDDYRSSYGSSFLVGTALRQRDSDTGIFEDVIYNLLFKQSFKIHIILNYFILGSVSKFLPVGRPLCCPASSPF